MTATTAQSPRTLPRPILRVFWALHRSLYRLTDGRFGLSRPKTGKSFGMMRLHTVGRSSGRPRVAILGYYEDGPNLVTLAMNGWGETEPAWWLNLQATPDAIVDLPDGPRRVRARAATGDERDRLWAAFPDYPGWGADIDGLARRRSMPTSVVVLEPRPVVTEGSQARTAESPTLPTYRLNLMRVGYLLMAVGLAVTKWPVILQDAASLPVYEGVAAALLTAMSLFAFLGLRYPVQLLPLLVFESTWKLIWLAAVAIPHLIAGDLDADMSRVMSSVSLVVVILAVTPWDYVWKRYVTAPGDRWRS